MNSIIVSFIGIAFLFFRLWLCEYKLRDELEFRRHYLSRILSYYSALVVVFNFENTLLNYITISTLPVIISSLIGWDSLFLIKFKKRTYWNKNHVWLVIERLTMHIPMLFIGIYLYMVGLPNIEWIEAVRLYIFTIPTIYWWFICIDKRWTEKYIWPTGLNIFIFATVSLIANAVYLVLH